MTVHDSFSLSMRQVTLDGKPATVEKKPVGWSGVTVTDCDGRKAVFTDRIATMVLRGKGGHFRTHDHSVVGRAVFGKLMDRTDRVAQAREALGL